MDGVLTGALSDGREDNIGNLGLLAISHDGIEAHRLC